MTSRTLELMATAVLATALWIVPSVGTRGQGTFGDRFVHADRDLAAPNAAGHAALQRADAVVAAAVAGL
ncbi:MAG: hypothetical protein H7268_01010 [Sandarakinorhabdus sp.]|nr:hypothetical protein [Sandarakinorhabdus sp.]